MVNVTVGPENALDHVVVLMFENRSFDNLLGRLYEPGEVASFEGVLGLVWDPPSSILGGEGLLARVYDAIRSSSSPTGSNPLNTTLLVTFDEHGGTYDHVPPGPARAPAAGAPAGQHGLPLRPARRARPGDRRLRLDPRTHGGHKGALEHLRAGHAAGTVGPWRPADRTRRRRSHLHRRLHTGCPQKPGGLARGHRTARTSTARVLGAPGSAARQPRQGPFRRRVRHRRRTRLAGDGDRPGPGHRRRGIDATHGLFHGLFPGIHSEERAAAFLADRIRAWPTSDVRIVQEYCFSDGGRFIAPYNTTDYLDRGIDNARLGGNLPVSVDLETGECPFITWQEAEYLMDRDLL